VSGPAERSPLSPCCNAPLFIRSGDGLVGQLRDLPVRRCLTCGQVVPYETASSLASHSKETDT
jgi:hypothetical protein